MSFVTLVMSAKILFFKINELSSYTLTLIVLVIYTMLMLVYTNINLLINKKQLIFSYKFNIVVCVLQILHIQIFGGILHFIAMSELSVYIISKSNLDLRFFASIYAGSLDLLYRSDLTGFVLGINLVPIIVFLVYLKLYKIHKKNISSDK